MAVLVEQFEEGAEAEQVVGAAAEGLSRKENILK